MKTIVIMLVDEASALVRVIDGTHEKSPKLFYEHRPDLPGAGAVHAAVEGVSAWLVQHGLRPGEAQELIVVFDTGVPGTKALAGAFLARWGGGSTSVRVMSRATFEQLLAQWQRERTGH